MAFNKQPDYQENLPATPGKPEEGRPEAIPEPPPVRSGSTGRLDQIQSLPHRNKLIHWGAFVLSIVAFILLSLWVFSPRGAVPPAWIWLDVGMSVLFAIEFFTRSGFRWARAKYLGTHYFDFVAIIPVLLLVHHGFILESVWLWIIWIARAARVIDRFLGDGFIRRTFWTLVEGFEEEITDRVLENILRRLQSDMDQAQFSRGVADALKKNKSDLLRRVHLATPKDGAVPRIAHLVKLDKALERIEEQTYDAIVGVIGSSELDRAVRDVVNSTFSRIRTEIGRKSWKQKFHFSSPWRR